MAISVPCFLLAQRLENKFTVGCWNKQELAGLDFPLSQQVLTTPDFESSHLRDGAEPQVKGFVLYSVPGIRKYPKLFPLRNQHQLGWLWQEVSKPAASTWGWGPSQCWGDLSLPRDLCAGGNVRVCVRQPVVSVLAESYLPTWKEFLGLLFCLRQSQGKR